MTPAQCHEARERLKWSRHDLTVASKVPLWFIAAFEDRRSRSGALVDYELAMSDAFEAAGIVFPCEIPAGRFVANDPAAELAFQELVSIIEQEAAAMPWREPFAPPRPRRRT